MVFSIGLAIIIFYFFKTLCDLFLLFLFIDDCQMALSEAASECNDVMFLAEKNSESSCR